MKLPHAIAAAATRFDRMSLRERAMVSGAGLIGLVMLWTVALFDPSLAREQALSAELSSLQESIGTMAQSMQAASANDPVSAALAQEKQLELELTQINAQLASKSAGLIAPEHMVQVIHDVLSRQRGVTLVSLHNKPVTTLAPAGAGAPGSGPYVHPVEIVVEGRYLDVLAYLQALEALEWRFYWRLLELSTTTYPVNRVRVELSTLSLDTSWIGV